MSKWLDNAIFYQIYPQSFCDTNSDGIGDINGIIKNLDYVKELGCNAIWLNPCYLSPFDDGGYDIEDYYTVAPRYGTNEDLINLFNEVHKRNMHIILDMVPGHTSYKHKWFKESCKDKKNEYTDRYIWTNSIWNAPNNMQWLRGIGQRDGAVAVNYFSTQPALNYGYLNPNDEWQQSVDSEGPAATKEELKKIMRFWLKAGCDGFRVDMADSLVKNDDENSSGTVALWQEFRKFLDKEFPEAVMVSEWGQPDKSLKGGFHMDFLLHFGPSHYNDLFRCDEPYFSSRGKGKVSDFIETYIKNYEQSERRGLICIPSGNHDMDRLARRLTVEEIKIAFAFLLSMPGAPFIYYGDEIGLNYVENITSVEGGFGRTGSRSPMQWNKGLNAGFSSAPEEKLYIPLDKNLDRPDVVTQIENSNSLYNEIKHLISIRMSHKPLQSNGQIEFITKSEYPLVYKRNYENETILVIINPSRESQIIETDVSCGEIIYSYGGSIKFIDEKAVNIDGCTTVFIKFKED